VSAQYCEHYDPTKYAGRNLAKRFRALFEETRARWLGDCAAIGIAHKAHRLCRQQQLAETAEDMGAIGLASEIYERAAKDAQNYWDRSHAGRLGAHAGLEEVSEELGDCG
jgi:hypothetical protein